MNASKAQLIEDLIRVGLPMAEAETYYALSLSGTAKAAEIASVVGRRRPDIYPILDRLIERGIAQRTTQKPALYLAIPIADAMRRVVATSRTDQRQLEVDANAIIEAWPPIRDDVELPSERIAIHQGLAQILAVLDDRVAAAKHHISCALTPGLLLRLGTVRDRLGQAAGQCAVRLLTVLDTDADLQALGSAQSAEVRHRRLPSHLEMVLIDSHEAFLFLSAGRADSTQGAPEQVLWLRTPDMALALQAVHDMMWDDAVPFLARRSQLSGEPVPVNRMLHGRWVRDQATKDAIGRATTEVLAVVDETTSRQWIESGVWEVLRSRVGEIRINISGPIDVEGLDVRRPDTPGTTATLVFIDRREAICGWPVENGHGLDSLWSNHPDTVQMMLDGLAEAPTWLPRAETVQTP